MSEGVLDAAITGNLDADGVLAVFGRHIVGLDACTVAQLVGVSAGDEWIISVEGVPLAPIEVCHACSETALTEALRGQF